MHSKNGLINFLKECATQSNKIVQLLKASSERIEEVKKVFSKSYNGLELQIPFYQNIITECRCIRAMIHVVIKSIDSQKENSKVIFCIKLIFFFNKKN